MAKMIHGQNSATPQLYFSSSLSFSVFFLYFFISEPLYPFPFMAIYRKSHLV